MAPLSSIVVGAILFSGFLAEKSGASVIAFDRTAKSDDLGEQNAPLHDFDESFISYLEGLAAQAENVTGRVNATLSTTDLIEHEILPGIYTMPWSYGVANGTAGAVEIGERDGWLWWSAMGTLSLANAGVTFYSLYPSCEAWHAGHITFANVLSCVWAAISTLGIIAGAGYKLYLKGALIGRALRALNNFNGINKRSEEIKQLLGIYQDFSARAFGMPLALMFDSEGNLMTHPENGEPVFAAKTHSGNRIMFSYGMPDINGNRGYAMHGFYPSSSVTKRQGFTWNSQNFLSGGLEAGYEFDNSQANGYLSATNDFQQMMDQMECLFPNLQANTLNFQLIDNNDNQLMDRGIIRAFQYTTFDVDSLYNFDPFIFDDEGKCNIA